MLTSLFFNKPAEANEAEFRLGLQLFKRTCQLLVKTVVKICAATRFA